MLTPPMRAQSTNVSRTTQAGSGRKPSPALARKAGWHVPQTVQMIKITLLGSALAVALSAAPAMAADFHALGGLQGTSPAPLQDEVLAATEGGATCVLDSATTTDGGVCLLAALPNAAFFSVANELPVTAAQFLQVHGFTAETLPIPPTP